VTSDSLSMRLSAGKNRAHSATTRQRADSSGQDGGHGAEPGGDEAGAEVAELVRGTDEEHVDGADPASHGVGRAELDDAGADEDADHVARPQDRKAEDRDAAEHGAAGMRMALRRETGEKEAHADSAGSDAAAHDAQAAKGAQGPAR
jgi:hypothetical protein